MNQLIACEAKLTVREPVGLAFSLVLPLVIILAFGLSASASEPDEELGGVIALDTLLPSIGLALSFGMVAIFMLPGFMTDYRARGILRRLSTTPVHPAKLLAAQVIVQGAIALISVPLVLGLAVALGMSFPEQPLMVVVVVLLGGAALFAVGTLVSAVAPDAKIGYVYSAMFFFPSLFFAGVWLPKEQMPDWLSTIGDFTPLGAFRESLENAFTGTSQDPLMLLTLAVTAVAAGTVAARVFRWE
ncbi:ABC transporter permease [Solirubrobacter sp. CPCC 204708]|uniref:Transport permease protein n=1 Tax=Solirubrobacter deserti TaxID=2282478 RepID=A0ABT4RF50_9ACTN|nr:ABC transporter permease [Solirubrobacter deserti]MBE2319548.1 ABC transporter permease [Solirubrobacter deserti]MDA0137165.1 ABC transporter permease [Solirubrobacter deserti]